MTGRDLRSHPRGSSGRGRGRAAGHRTRPAAARAGQRAAASTAPGASAAHRFAMAALATQDRPDSTSPTCEMRSNEPSLHQHDAGSAGARAGLDAQTVCFVIGADAFREIRTWKTFPAILDRCHFVVVSRPGHPAPRTSRRAAGVVRAYDRGLRHVEARHRPRAGHPSRSTPRRRPCRRPTSGAAWPPAVRSTAWCPRPSPVTSRSIVSTPGKPIPHLWPKRNPRPVPKPTVARRSPPRRACPLT